MRFLDAIADALHISNRRNRRTIKRATKHLVGPKRPSRTGVICFALVRNAGPWIKEFLDHHLGLGVAHVILMDNGSSDRTVAIAAKYDHVTVLSCPLPYKYYKYDIRLWLVNTYGKKRWCLVLDGDELFDYPGSDAIGIDDLTAYLARSGYDAVLAHMLDMHPGILVRGEEEILDRRRHRFFEIASCVSQPYPTDQGNRFDPQISHTYLGGLRKRLFGLYGLWLWKHPLFYHSGRLGLFPDSHNISKANVADFNAVLLHYKFVSSLFEYAAWSSQSEVHTSNSFEYKAYHRELKKADSFDLCGPDTLEYTSVDQLVDLGFLACSRQYQRFVTAERERTYMRDTMKLVKEMRRM